MILFYKVDSVYYAITEGDEYIEVFTTHEKMGALCGKKTGMKDVIEAAGQRITFERFADECGYVSKESECLIIRIKEMIAKQEYKGFFK